MSGSEGATIRELTARLERYDRDGDGSHLLDTAAHQAALAMHAAILDSRAGTTDAQTLRVLGHWFLGRYHALPTGSGQADLRSARLCAGLLRDLGEGELTDAMYHLLTGDTDDVARTHETALSLLDAFDNTGDHTRVTAADDLIRSLESTLPADHPLRPELLVSATYVASARLTIRADPADIETMLRAARASLARAAPDDPALTEKVCVLAWALLASYEHSDKLANLDQALRLTESHLHDETGQLEANVATMLANLLRVRNERTRSTTDLDRAVALCREAAASIPSGHPQRFYVLQSLAMCLVARVQHLDRADDVTEAIELCREILPRVGQEGPIGCVWSINLATMLSWRVRRGYDVDDVHEAVTLARRTLAATERLVGIRPLALVTLANTLALRFGVTGRRDDLAEAIGHLREAIAKTPPKGAQKGIMHAKLTWLVGLSPNAEEHAGAGLDEAIEHGRLALAALAPGHPDRVVALTALGGVYEQRYLAGGDRADLDAAIGAWRSAAGSAYGPPDARMLAARSWRDAAVRVRDLPDAAEAAATAVSLLPVLAWRGLDREVQERKLANTAGLASSAAALAIELGRAEHAVELIEQGRTVLWSQAVQTRDDLSSLRAAAPELADGLDQTRQALNGIASLAGTGHNADRELRGYRELVAHWDELLSRARALPGFATFLGATPFARLRAASADGPVVIINASAPRCDALIVRAGGVHVVPLPWLSLADVHHRADGLLAALVEVEQGGPARTNLRQTLWSLLRWLWDTVAAPVLTELDTLDGPHRHRVWWCPTGPLTLLPLHAAGRYGTMPRWEQGRRPTVPDRTVSSYTTGLGALIRARRPVGGAAPRLLAVGLPETPGRAPLPAVVDELNQIAAAVPDTRTLVGASATPQAVLAALGQYQWAHFACHATQRVDRPGLSALHLASGNLSVLSLAAQDLSEAQFAYLSACQTAGGSPALADEIINLASALQLAGYRHVIGTQWPVADTDAALAANSVYRRMTVDSCPNASTAAHALAEATDHLRTLYPDRPETWAPFVHIGP